MKVKALRGVCIGVDRHLVAGDIADLEPALVTFLRSINAVENFNEPTPTPESEPKAPEKTGKKEK